MTRLLGFCVLLRSSAHSRKRAAEKLNLSCSSPLEALAVSEGHNNDQSVNQDIFSVVWYNGTAATQRTRCCKS